MNSNTRLASLKEEQKAKRIWEIDYLRGLMILLMIMDHFFYDFGYLLSMLFSTKGAPEWLINLSTFARFYWNHDARIITRIVIISLFFVVSGISSYLSKHNLKRSLFLLGAGVFISLASYLASIILQDPTVIMIISTLTTFGISIFLYWFLHKLYSLFFKNHPNCWKYVSLVIGLVIIVLGFLFKFYNPKALSFPPENIEEWVGILIGKYYYGSDWMPLLPYVGYIFLGAFIGETVYKNKQSVLPSKLNNSFTRPVNFVGRHSMYFYLLHQVVLVLGMILLCIILGLPINNFL